MQTQKLIIVIGLIAAIAVIAVIAVVVLRLLVLYTIIELIRDLLHMIDALSESLIVTYMQETKYRLCPPPII